MDNFELALCNEPENFQADLKPNNHFPIEDVSLKIQLIKKMKFEKIAKNP